MTSSITDLALDQWMTDRELARRVVEWADVRSGMHVLEPSCGDGAFVDALYGRCAELTACEIDRDLAALAVSHYPRVMLWCGDFLSMQADGDEFDLAIGNPPYFRGTDLRHVLHALELAPRVVMVLRLVFLAGKDRHSMLWEHHTLGRLAILPKRPDFPETQKAKAARLESLKRKGKEPSDGGARSDFAVYEILRGKHAHVTTQVEWWV